MKRRIALLLSVVVTLSTLTNVVAAEIVPISAIDTENKVLELSIEDAVKMAIENDRNMWKIEDGIKQAQDARKAGKDAKELAEQLIGSPLSFTSEMNITDNYIDLLLSKNNYYTKTAELKTKELEKNRDLLLKGIEIETKTLYYQVLLATKAIEINEAKINKANEQLRVVNLKFNSGSTTKAEVLNAEIAIQQARTDLDSAIDDLNIAKLNLLNKLSLPFETEIVLTDKDLTYVPTQEIKLTEKVELAKAERPEILTANNNLELQKIKTHAYTAYYTSNLRQHKASKEELKDAELNVPQAYKEVELDVRKSYLNLIKAERALLNMDKTVELAKEAARIQRLLYNNGMSTSLDVLDADTNLAQAEIGRYQLLASYTINKLFFDNSNLIGSSGIK